jgi:hypothetical protein
VSALVPIPGLDSWHARQEAVQRRGRDRFAVAVRVAQANQEAVICAGCGHGLNLRNAGATTSPGGVTRCAPCAAKARA